ncbi:putative receptor-like protein kinase At3g47110 [Triticum dicoccoides]|uniref:putative receptor-like protein kinase At3g47110 n=1 Tax=Triticum dicoccoides TaxID=85692 RepID=UPI0018917CC3|nr:putative receptor-like protein kinase At3g47110 [Triticum dicoccoides]
MPRRSYLAEHPIFTFLTHHHQGKPKLEEVCRPTVRSIKGNINLMGLAMLVLPVLLGLFYGASDINCSIVHGNTTDHHSLLDFKGAIRADPRGALRSWNENIHYYMWSGIKCITMHPEHVTVLNLANMSLTGQITPSLGNLTFLQELTLSNNLFSGQLPPLNCLIRLEILYLQNNLLQGNIPNALTNCSKLLGLDLSSNMLVGLIPGNIGSLYNLMGIDLSTNSLTGNIPPTFGNNTYLEELRLTHNQLKGSIPEELGKLPDMTKDRAVFLGQNRLSGRVPATLFNLSKLIILDLSTNKLRGTLPYDIGNLSVALQWLVLGANNLSGTVPPSIGALKNLTVLDLGGNNFVGPIPYSVGNLPKLWKLDLSNNHFDSW